MKVYDTIKLNDQSRRVLDKVNGYLKVLGNPVAVAGVYAYKRSDVDSESTSDDIVYVYRPVQTLHDSKDEFANKPIIRGHEDVGSNGTRHTVEGTIGSDVWVRDNKLYSDLIIYNPKLINDIQTGVCEELSPGYQADIVRSPGNYEGADYEYVMSITSVNHLAVVPKGRAGSDLKILDKGEKMSQQRVQNDTVTEVNNSDILHSPIPSQGVQDHEGSSEETSQTSAPQKGSQEHEETFTINMSILKNIVRDTVQEAMNKQEETLCSVAQATYAKEMEKQTAIKQGIHDAAMEVSKHVGYLDPNVFANKDAVYSYGYQALTGIKLKDEYDAKTAFYIASNQVRNTMTLEVKDEETKSNPKYTDLLNKYNDILKR